MIYDYCVIGGGIVGVATAMELLKAAPGARILLLEKERCPGLHQTGHNSGVIHAGIYYAPGSLKAQLCREGLIATKEFCRKYQISYEECGKLIVATNEVELSRIEDLYVRASQNGLKIDRLDKQALNAREPNISGLGALYSPETAIVDYAQICNKIAQIIVENGATIRYGMSVEAIQEFERYVEIKSGTELFHANKLVVCGGLQADRLARIAGIKIDFKIIPFRGEYYQLPANKNNIVQHLIYPAPDPSLPFLGIHLTRMIDGSVTVGPNAVLGFSREGYAQFSFSVTDAVDFFHYAGFWKLLFKYRNHAMHEFMTSIQKSSYLKECQKYCPSLILNDLRPFRAGIRAQLVNDAGDLVHDFVFKQTERMLHVCNAPSPAATSAIPIGRFIAERAQI